MNDILEKIKFGTADIINIKSLEKKLASKKILRVKLGVDPTSPDIHLGHTIAMRKLRQFQDLGHIAVLIIGDFTAMIGDPSGRSVTRPPLTHEEVKKNAQTYLDQCFKVLDRDKTEIVYNGDWFNKMTYKEVIKLNSRVTMQQMMQREDFKSRIKNSQEVRLHEIQYPIMQGWDSVVVKSDIELGGTDQLFNILVGRDLQESEGMEPQVAILLPILEGLDGVKKMSKSLDNYIGVSDSPDTMFGKVMSISDDLMEKYYAMLLGETLDKTSEGYHPMNAKKNLAKKIISIYHDDGKADQALVEFEKRFSSKKTDKANWPKFDVNNFTDKNLIELVSSAYKEVYNLNKSNSDIRRLIQSGSVQINGEKQDVKTFPTLKSNDVIRMDKKHSVEIL